MKQDDKVNPAFNEAAERIAKSTFELYLKSKFSDDATVRGIVDMFDKMGLPLPENHQQFMAGTEGALVFLNKYGVVLRIEKGQHGGGDDFTFGFTREEDFYFDRIDDSPWILKPIATLNIGTAIVEVCPGCRTVTNQKVSDDLVGKLRDEGIDFWDKGARNVGRIPVATPKFPHGIPVVVDRPAVRRLTEQTQPLVEKLNRITGIERREEAKREEARRAEAELYAPLQKSFADSWPSKRKMKAFWQACERYVAEGKLVAGWNEKDPMAGFDISKSRVAAQVARGYDMRMGNK